LQQYTQGLPAQINEIQQYCIKNNITIYEIYTDEGISGTKEERPAFQKMIKDAEKGLFNIILVHKFDRFARRIELSHKIKARLKKASVNVISITEPIEDSPIGFFQEGLLELLAEYYIRNLSKEVKKGLVERASQGLHNGMLPFGYVLKNGEVIVHEDQAVIVRLIFDLYINSGYGYGKIAKHLNYAEIKTQTGKAWSHYQIDRILENVKYAGWIYYAGQTYDSKLPTILDKETFAKAQELRSNKEGKSFGYRGKNYEKFLLIGMIRCGECGNVFKAWSNRKQRYYVCNYATRHLADGKCSFTKLFPVQKLEEHILREIKSMMQNKKIQLNVVKREPVLNLIENTRAKLNNELVRAKEAYLRGIFDLDEYEETKKRVEKELAQTKIVVEKKEDQGEVRKNIKNVLDEFNSCPEENIIGRKNILKKIISEIKMFKTCIVIEFKE
jgi:site-specific DNA recombinase